MSPLRCAALLRSAGEVAALYHFNEAEHLHGPAVLGDSGEPGASRGWEVLQ